jgi:hypothetical protein
MLSGAAPDFQCLAGAAREGRLKDLPDRIVIAMEWRRV